MGESMRNYEDEITQLMQDLKVRDFVIENISLPILIFDGDNVLQTCNQTAQELFEVSTGISLQEFVESNNLKYILTSERHKAGKTKHIAMAIEYGNKSYLIQGEEIWTPEDVYAGIIFIFNDITGQEQLKNEMGYHATKDSLTGLWNREFFMEMVDRTLMENPDEKFLMLASNIHQFKIFNDILGKRTGDNLLKAIAAGIEMIKKPMWVSARISADRFALLIPKKDFSENELLDFVHRILEQKEYSLVAHNYIGVYEITDPSIGASGIYDRAYMALDSIKGSVHREIAYYDEEIRKKLIYETTTVEVLDRAMKEEQFVIYLQPQIDIFHNKLVGCEALVRWNNPNRGLVPPYEFIPLFEEHGIIYKLDYYVWDMACRQLRKWKDEGHEERSISVNISAKDFYLSDIYQNITGLVEKYDISPKNLKLEITESAFVLDVTEQMALVKRFQDQGFILEIDDFGSGYSSLNSLKDIQVDVLKLDMKFFEKSNDPQRALCIIKSVIQLANDLGMPIIAEGVEDKEQVDMLRGIGCQIVQGYYYSCPIPVDEFEKFMQEYEWEDFQAILNSK